MLFGGVLALTALIVSTEAAPNSPRRRVEHEARQLAMRYVRSSKVSCAKEIEMQLTLTMINSPWPSPDTSSGWVSWQQAISSPTSVKSYVSPTYPSPPPPSFTASNTASQWSTWYQSSSSQSQTYTSNSPSVSSYVSPTYVSPAPTSLTTSTISSSVLPTGPCGSVAVLAASSSAANPSATPRVPAQLAFECLNSIPFNQSAAIRYLDSITPYVTWQTTLEFLKDPPAEVSNFNVMIELQC